jgi:hypothetical protein
MTSEVQVKKKGILLSFTILAKGMAKLGTG